MNTDKIYAEAIANEYAPKETFFHNKGYGFILGEDALEEMKKVVG